MKKGLHFLKLLVSFIFVIGRKLWPLFLGLVLFSVLNWPYSGTTFALSQLVQEKIGGGCSNLNAMTDEHLHLRSSSG
jgi:hypothetical protein